MELRRPPPPPTRSTFRSHGTPSPTGTGDNNDNGAPASGFASVSNLVSVTAGGAPTSEVDTNDTDGAEGETNNSTMDLSDTNIDLTIDSGFVLDVIDSGGRPPPVLQGA